MKYYILIFNIIFFYSCSNKNDEIFKFVSKYSNSDKIIVTLLDIQCSTCFSKIKTIEGNFKFYEKIYYTSVHNFDIQEFTKKMYKDKYNYEMNLIHITPELEKIYLSYFKKDEFYFINFKEKKIKRIDD